MYQYKDKDPSGKALKEPGTKGDEGKAPIFRGVLSYFPRALGEVARCSDRGARKYSWKGWETVPDGINRYSDALARHLLAEGTEGAYDSDTGLLHATQVCWNSLARLELILREKEMSKPTNFAGLLPPGTWIPVSHNEAKRFGIT